MDGCICTAGIGSISFPISTVFQFICRMFSVSMSGMPNKACPFPGTTKNLHIFYLLLYSIFTLHMPNCVILLLYVFNWMFLFFVATNCFFFVALGDNLFYKCKSIMFPSLPVSTSYGTITETWFDNVFRFAVITDHLLLKIIEFLFTMSI